ncbi:uncharacterized protein MONBRDRAFT_23662 [Monosiga brevicollis MX1]|uniref:NmrA-like domain-containing protein n=1 Tax=Monosiga brevicollis TaxID=81824 RepID=A9UU37_MONBE|nr:uncharacterized protein MONBRDRAFT_23662 [Monosiga brevicollis MX1]EDQ91354.1 predicted protein [Monosiga brevicollis MX1]|eukprot:XP_001743776.1 hypothetical protein [Monosiga brevicollis MX1]
MTSLAQNVVVIGSSGQVGTATIKALAAKYASNTNVKAGVRDPQSAKAREIERLGTNIHVVHADMNDKPSIRTVCANADAVFVVVPGHIDRERLAQNAIEGAVAANAKFILLLSVITADTDTIFGRQFGPIERYLKNKIVDYAILRVPFFIDNLWSSQATIRSQSKIYAPVNSRKKFSPVAVSDVGEAAAAILANHEPHHGKTYKVAMKPTSYSKIAKSVSKVLDKDVDYVQVSWDETKQAFLQLGYPEWQVNGMMELLRYFDKGSKVTKEKSSDVKELTGHKATGVKSWMRPKQAAFH